MDNTKTSWWQAHRPTTRRLAQLYAALLYNAHLRGFVSGEIYKGNAKYACVPGFNCYSCPGAVGSCPLGALQNALGSAGHRAGWYVLGIIMLYGVILGRTICGWLCPLGLIQELLHKIPTPKIPKSRITRALSWLKYVILVVFAVAIPLQYGLMYDVPLPGFCKYICPAGTFEGAIALLANPKNAAMFGTLRILFTRKFVIMLIIALACIFCYRSFCRFICPLGAIFGLFNRFNLIGVKVDTDRCSHCGNCVRSCGMDVRRVGDHECINCARCMSVCNQKAITFKAGKAVLLAPEGGCPDDTPDAPAKRRRLGRIIWGIALAGLCFALVWFNFLDPAVKKEIENQRAAAVEETVEAEAVGTDTTEEAAGADAAEEDAAETAGTDTAEESAEESAGAEAAEEVSYESSAPIGSEVGQQLQDFTITCLDGSEFHLADYRGKIVFLNLWGTWCTPCVAELPYFNELYQKYGEEIGMLAVHTSLVTADPEEYVKEKGWTMPVAVDLDDEIAEIVSGGDALPQTIVLNRKGEVVFNESRSVNAEMLEALYKTADESA